MNYDMLTISAENGGWVRYQLLPAFMHEHRVNPVYYDIEVNPDGSRVKFPANDLWHCINCGLMATRTIMKDYSCLPRPQAYLIQYRRDDYTPTEEDFDKYSTIRTEAGWWTRKVLWNDQNGVFYLERKWMKSR